MHFPLHNAVERGQVTNAVRRRCLWRWPKCRCKGVSTHQVRAVTEELCGHGLSASTVSAATKQLDAELERVMNRPLSEEYPHLIQDAR